MQLTNDFVAAVKLNPRRSYRIAQEADLHPCVLSKLLNGIEQPRKNDPRVLAVARVIDFPVDKCFVDEVQTNG